MLRKYAASTESNKKEEQINLPLGIHSKANGQEAGQVVLSTDPDHRHQCQRADCFEANPE